MALRRRLGAGLIATALVATVVALVGAHPAAADGTFTFGPDPLPAAVAGNPYLVQLTATGADLTPPIVWGWNGASPRPPGIGIDDEGHLTGYPPIGTSGTFTVDARAEDAAGVVDTHQYTLVIGLGPQVVDDLPPGAVGVPYEHQLQVQDGTPPYTFEAWYPYQPRGIELDADGRLHGTPTGAGTSFVLKVTDGAGVVGYTLVLLDIPRVVTTSLPQAEMGRFYRQMLKADGACGSFVWSLAGGGLPPGLELSPDGTLAGTVDYEVAGDYPLVVAIEDGCGNVRSAALTISVPEARLPDVPWITASANADTIRLSWSRDSDGGSPITGSTITPYVGDVAQAPIEVDGPSQALVIGSGLVPGTTYQFTVTSNTAIGSSAPSPRSAAVTYVVRPSPPSIVSVAARQEGVEVTWEPPSDDGGAPIDHYVVQGVHSGGHVRAEATVPAGQTSVVVGDMPAGAGYRMVVTAVNQRKLDRASSPSDLVRPTPSPSSPTNLRAEVGNRVVTLTWDPPAVGSVRDYRVTAIGSSGGSLVSAISFDSSIEVTRLPMGYPVYFLVEANDEFGNRVGAAATDSVTPIGTAPPPTSVTALPGDRSATVSWDAPEPVGGPPLDGYEVVLYDASGERIGMKWVNAPATSALLTNLAPGAPVHVVVSAVYHDSVRSSAPPTGDVTPFVLPSAPTAVTATPSGSNVVLTWIPPASSGSSPITGWVVTPDADGVVQTSVSFAGGAANRTLSGLTLGATYQFRVAAKTADGVGPASALTIPLVFGAPAKPGFPAAQPGDRGAKVVWSPPSDNGSAVTSYVVTPYLGSIAQPSTTVGAPTTSVQLTGLTNGGAYTFKIAAVNGRGRGPEATTAPTMVGAPTTAGFVAASPAETEVRVGWSGASPNGAPVQGYRVTPTRVGVGDLPEIDFHSTARLQTITGLVAGATYTFRIVAYNAFGDSPMVQTPQVIAGSPTAPGFQSATPGDGSAMVHFATPQTNGSPITRYTVWPVRNNVVLAPQVFDTPNATSLTVTGLTNGWTYSFRVAADNGRGQSPYASTNSVTVGTPLAPAFPAAQPGNGSARVVWTATSANGSPVTSYVVTPYLGSVAQPTRTFPAPATSATVTGLANGQAYTFRVVAKNAVGLSLVSSATNAVKVGTPTAPVFPTAKPGDGTAIVAAGAPTANGGPITGYVVTPMVGTVARPSQTFTGTATTWTVTGLTNGTTYTFRVAAINGFGTGPYATTPAVKVGTPSAPTGVIAAKGTQSATVNWTAPSGNGSPITGYIVTPYIGGAAQPARTFDATATSRVITGLTTGTAYTFKVQATNALGTSLPSSATAPVIPT